MAIGHSGTKDHPPKRARTMRGMCRYCFKPIVPGQLYEERVGGTNIKRAGLAHSTCYGPQVKKEA